MTAQLESLHASAPGMLITGGSPGPFVARRLEEGPQGPEAASLSDEQMADVLNASLRRGPWQWGAAAVAIVATLLASAAGGGEQLAGELSSQLTGKVGACGLLLTLLVRYVENRRRRPLLLYRLDEAAVQRFQRMSRALSELAASGVLRRVEQLGTLADWKRNAGATRALTFSKAALRVALPPRLASNLTPWTLRVRDAQLAFFPDRILLWRRGRYEVLGYGAIDVSSHAGSFVWSEPMPRDAQVEGHTWQYVRKDGGPDGRFKDNRQLPVVAVTYLTLESAGGLQQVVQTSRVDAGERVARELRRAERSAHSLERVEAEDAHAQAARSRVRDPGDPQRAVRSARGWGREVAATAGTALLLIGALASPPPAAKQGAAGRALASAAAEAGQERGQAAAPMDPWGQAELARRQAAPARGEASRPRGRKVSGKRTKPPAARAQRAAEAGAGAGAEAEAARVSSEAPIDPY